MFVTRGLLKYAQHKCATFGNIPLLKSEMKENSIMKKWISRHNALAAVSTVTAAAMLTACGGAASSSAASSAASQADSAASSGEASSAAESWGDVKLTMWGAEEDQTMLREMADAFIAENADKGNVTCPVRVQRQRYRSG
jgi:arabinogalactan oligomer/maltooligosaccharide transport system substrate-binding protein